MFRNDEFELEELKIFDKIVLSPGPGIPNDAGLLKSVIAHYAPTKSILGVCLGQQAIGEVFGGTLINLSKVYHGIATDIKITQKDDLTFEGLPETFKAGRYHSWAVDTKDFPGAIATGVTSVVCSPCLGWIPALAISTATIKEKNLGYPNNQLMKNSSYSHAYKQAAQKKKTSSTWIGFAAGTVAYIAIYIVLSVQGII